MNKSPKICIITVAYNSDKTISNTIDSVLSQEYDNIEYIIIDGGSIDTTNEINSIDQSTYASMVPTITLCISTCSSLIIAGARHLKIEEHESNVANLRNRFSELVKLDLNILKDKMVDKTESKVAIIQICSQYFGKTCIGILHPKKFGFIISDKI